MGQDLLGCGGSGNDDGLLGQGGGDGIGELLGAARVGLADDPQQLGLRRSGHGLGPAELLDHREALLGGQPGSDNAFQGRVDLGEQSSDAVRQPGRFGGEVLVEPDQHLQLREGFLAGVDPAQGVGHGPRGVGDDERVAGVGLGVARVEVCCAAHGQPGQVGDLDSHGPGDRDG